VLNNKAVNVLAEMGLSLLAAQKGIFYVKRLDSFFID
jgi:hypothetical protein